MHGAVSQSWRMFFKIQLFFGFAAALGSIATHEQTAASQETMPNKWGAAPVAPARELKLRHVLLGHTDQLTCVAFSPTGKILASASLDGTIRFWDLNTRTATAVDVHSQGIAVGLAFMPDGKTVATGSNTRVMLLDTGTAKTIATLEGHAGAIHSLAISPDGKTLAVASGRFDGPNDPMNYAEIKLWDIPTHKNTSTSLRHPRSSWVGFSPNGKLLATRVNNTIEFFALPTDGRACGSIKLDCGLYHAAFSPDGRTIAVANPCKEVELWEIASCQRRAKYEGSGEVRCVAFSPDGKTLAAGFKQTIKIMSVFTGATLCTTTDKTPGDRVEVHWVAFSPNGKTLASVGTDNSIKLWDVGSAK